jgi:eukaryotic-like serine/threonine-protein kinase
MTVDNQPSHVLAGRYRLDAPLGQNGDGWFCRAHDLVLNLPVTVKMFETVLDAAAARVFATRARSLVGVRHDHLVALYDEGVADGHPYLVLAPIDGFEPLDATDGRTLPASETAAFGAELADALARMHASGVVHGGVTPASVLIDSDARARLVSPGLGHTGDLTASADVRALGLVLVQCLTGSAADQLPATTPWPLARVLTAMTSRNPTRRPNAAVCARRLGHAAAALKTGRWSPTAAMVQRGRVAGITAVGGLVTGAVIAFAPGSPPQHIAASTAAPVPTTASRLPAPDPTSTETAPGRPTQPAPPTTRRSPTSIAGSTTSAAPTTQTQPSATTSAEPSTSAEPTTDVPTTTETVPPGHGKKPPKEPPGLLKKWFWLADDAFGWPLDW